MAAAEELTAGRGRPANLDGAETLSMFLRAVSDHPWAGPGLLQAYGGLTTREMSAIRSSVAKNGPAGFETRQVRLSQKSPLRYAVKAHTAIDLGDPPLPKRALQDALFRVRELDVARLLLAEWCLGYGADWALSPFTVSADDLKPAPRKTKEKKVDDVKFEPYRSIRADALACLPIRDRAYLHALVLIDPGDISVSWLYYQFRSFYAWGRRHEFHGRKMVFPIFVLVASNQTRLTQCLHLWEMCARRGEKPEQLFATTRWMVVKTSTHKRIWWNERFQQTPLWAGTVSDRSPTAKPDRLPAGKPGHQPPLTARPTAPRDEQKLARSAEARLA